MAEKKKTAVKTVEKTSKKSAKKIVTQKAGAKAKPEEKVKIDSIQTTEKGKDKSEKRGVGAIICAIIITFFVTAMLFGTAFFIFMNLDVIDDQGRVKIEHGKIYIDNRHRKCVDMIDDEGQDTIPKAENDDAKEEEKPSTSSSELIENPHSRASVKGAQLVEINDFEVFLPKNFEPSRANGNGKYVYNLADDDGWADVEIYAEKTTADLLAYMQRKDSLLRLTNSSNYINGTSWAEMESGSSVAYGTRLGDMVYVVILNVKLESDSTAEAEQMIAKTVRLKRIYK